MVLFLIAALGLWAAPAWGAGGQLPRGQIPPLTEQELASTEISRSTRTCFADFATSIGETGFFTEDGASYFHMSKVGEGPAEKQGAGRKQWFRYNLHRVDVATSKVFVVAALDLPEVDAIIPHADPVGGVTAVIFQFAGVPCRDGDANYATISLEASTSAGKGKEKRWRKKALPRAVQDRGNMAIVSGPGRNLLYSHDRKSILEMDFRQFQTRFFQTQTPAGQRPLYIDLRKRLQYSWKVQSSRDGVVRSVLAHRNADTAVAEMRLAPADRLLMDRHLFGVLQLDAETNSIKIREVKGWSGRNAHRDFVITLPADISVVDADFEVSFMDRYAFVIASSDLLKKRWRRGFVYDYEKGWELGRFRAPRGEYMSLGELSPWIPQASDPAGSAGEPTGASATILPGGESASSASTRKAIAAVSETETGFVTSFYVFSFNSLKWRKFDLPEIR